MNVGDCLDDAAAALARAQALMRTPAASGAEQATVASARTRLYRHLERQVALLTATAYTSAVAGPGEGSDPDLWPAGAMRAWLRQAVERTSTVMPTGLPQVPIAGRAGTALHQAAEAVAAANELIADNLGHRRPRSVEGVTMAAGYGRADNLAATATLALAADAIDTRIHRDGWLRPGPDAGAWLPLLLTVGEDVQRSANEGMSVTALRVLGHGTADRAPGREMRPVPIIDDPSRWAVVTSARHAATAMDAAQAWLLQHRHRLTAAQIAAIARAAVTIIAHVGYVLAHTDPPAAASDLSRAAAKQWRHAALAAAALRSSAPAAADIGTAGTAVNAVARWLTEELQGDHSGPPQWAGDDRATVRWRRTAGEIAGRLGDVAELLRDGVRQAQRQSNLLAAGRLHRPAGRLIHVPQWVPVEPDHPTYRRLVRSLTRAAQCSQPLTQLAGVHRTAGRSEPTRPAQPPTVAVADAEAQVNGAGGMMRTQPQPGNVTQSGSQQVCESVAAAVQALASRVQELVDRIAGTRDSGDLPSADRAPPHNTDLAAPRPTEGTHREID